MNQFYVGQEVVCVDDKVPIEGGSVVKDANITEGQVYRLRWVGMTDHYVFGEYLGVRLDGIQMHSGKDCYGDPDCPYAARRFRPLVADPMKLLRSIAANPKGHVITAPEGPTRGAPKQPEAPIKVKEEV